MGFIDVIFLVLKLIGLYTVTLLLAILFGGYMKKKKEFRSESEDKKKKNRMSKRVCNACGTRIKRNNRHKFKTEDGYEYFCDICTKKIRAMLNLVADIEYIDALEHELNEKSNQINCVIRKKGESEE